MSQSNYFNVLLYTAVVFHTVVITVSFATAVDLLEGFLCRLGKQLKRWLWHQTKRYRINKTCPFCHLNNDNICKVVVSVIL